MLGSYRATNNGGATTKNPTTIGLPGNKNDNNKAKEQHAKGQPILPEVGQFVTDPNTGTKYVRGRLMGKVSAAILFLNSKGL